MTVTVIGVGGTGSSVAVQLARMGVRRLRLVDRDVIDDTNVPRVYGSTTADIGKPKVIVLKNHIASFSKTQVEAVHRDIVSNDLVHAIVDSDVLFGCTDNLASRSVLNAISIQYYIPLIDIGCRILGDGEGSIIQAAAKVQLVTPDTACL